MKSSMEPSTSPLQPSSSASSVTQDTVHTYEDDQGRCREPQPKEQVEVDQDVTELLTLGSSRSTPASLSCVSSTGRASTLGSHSSENVVAEQVNFHARCLHGASLEMKCSPTVRFLLMTDVAIFDCCNSRTSLQCRNLCWL